MTSPEPERRDGSLARYSAEELLQRRDAILDAVARCNERMAGIRPCEEFASDVLRMLGEATGVSRVYVFELKRGNLGQRIACQRFEWAAPGVEPQIANPDLQAVDLVADGYARWDQLLIGGQPVVGDIAQFPASERPLLEMQGILSLLVQPIFAGSHLWGMIGFDSCARTQSWDKVEVDVLRIAAFAFGAAILRHEREEQIIRMQRLEAMGRMAGGVAHDFNNVLTVLTGAVEAIVDEASASGPPPTLRAYADLAQTALSQGQRLTRKLLDFSRQRAANPVEVDLGAVLRRADPLLRQAAGSMVRLDIHCADGTPPVRIDPVQFEQVLLNLVVNAKDAISNRGRVRIDLDACDTSASADLPAGQWLRLRVADDGPGIPAAIQARIFEPFFTTKADQGGTGLGLSTVEAIVAGCGGRVTATNGNDGGAEFCIYLPAVARGS